MEFDAWMLTPSVDVLLTVELDSNCLLVALTETDGNSVPLRSFLGVLVVIPMVDDFFGATLVEGALGFEDGSI